MSDTAAYAYDPAVGSLARGNLDWQGEGIQVVLVAGGYIPSQRHRATSEIDGFVVSSPAPLRNRSIDESTPGRVVMKAGASRFPNFSGEFQYSVIFRGDQLIAYSDHGPQQVSNGQVIVEYPNNEVFELVIDLG